MRLRPWSMLAVTLCTLCGPIIAMGQMSDTVLNRILARGGDLFHADVGCWVCHAATGEGLVGPTLHFGPTPIDIWDQLQSNPIMGVIVTELDPTNEDLIAVAMYVRTLAGLPEDRTLPDRWRADLEALQASQGIEPEFPKTERDLQVEAIERFDSLQSTWTRRATEGNLLSQYESRIVRTWEPGEPKFEPQPGKTYFYQNVGTASSRSVLFDGYRPPEGNQLVVGDAETLEVIASYEMPRSLRAAVHTTVMSPDGKFAYMTGPREPGPDGDPEPLGSWTILKIDAITLQPVAQITVGARLHHGQVFGDLVMFDWFQRDPDQRMGVSFLDPRSDMIVGGIEDAAMGGYFYNVWTDKDYEYIYALMEPGRLRPRPKYGHGRCALDVLGASAGDAPLLDRQNRPANLGGGCRVSASGVSRQLGCSRFGQGVHLPGHDQLQCRKSGSQNGRGHLDERHRHRALRRFAERGRDGTLDRGQGRGRPSDGPHRHRHRHRGGARLEHALRGLQDRPCTAVAQRPGDVGIQ